VSFRASALGLGTQTRLGVFSGPLYACESSRRSDKANTGLRQNSFLVWYRRRRRAATAVAARPGNQVLPLSTSMEQVSVERWLEQQTTNSDIEQYATDTWYVHSSISTSYLHPVIPN